MLQPDLSDQQRIALAELLPKLNSSAASLRRASLAALAPSGLVAAHNRQEEARREDLEAAWPQERVARATPRACLSALK